MKTSAVHVHGVGNGCALDKTPTYQYMYQLLRSRRIIQLKALNSYYTVNEMQGWSIIGFCFW